MYRDDQTVSLDYKAVSQHALFEDECIFLSLPNPSEKVFKGIDLAMLPIIGVVKKLDPSFAEGNIE
jgi:hypothetical protein